MNRLRKVFLCLVALATFSLPAAMPTAAEASPTHVRTVSHRAYYVYARTCPHSSWSYVGYTYDYNQALYYVSYVRGLGYDAFVR